MILIAKLGIMGEGVCEDRRLYYFDLESWGHLGQEGAGADLVDRVSRPL